MQAAPPPAAQVLPEVAESVPLRRGPVAAPVAVEPDQAAPSVESAPPVAEGPPPTRPRPDEPVRDPVRDEDFDGLQSVPLTRASREPSDAAAGDAAAGADSLLTTSEAAGPGATAIPRRPVIDDAARSRTDVPWLGIVSWLLLCGALFASLVGWPGQTALDRATEFWAHGFPGTILAGRPAPDAPIPTQDQASPPAGGQDRSDLTPGTPEDAQTLPPIDLAPPIRSNPSGVNVERTPGGPPVPEFKPRVDRVAAKFSHAFFEIGDRLQQQGDFDGAIHMRQQAANLDPWKTSRPSSSDL